MKNYLRLNNITFNVVLTVSLTVLFAVISEASSNTIRTVLVKDQIAKKELIKSSNKVGPDAIDIEEDQIVNISDNNNFIYIVPIRINTGDKRGCYIYNFDKNFNISQKVRISDSEDNESCEIINAVFSCNMPKKQNSGVGILYGKRLGSNHNWFEGSYLILNQNGRLSEEKMFSERMTDIETVSKAKKKLGCR